MSELEVILFSLGLLAGFLVPLIQNPDGGADDCGYYDHSFIERWAQQPDLPAPKD